MAVAVQCGGTLLASMGKLLFARSSGRKIEDFSSTLDKAVIRGEQQSDPNWRSGLSSCYLSLTMEAECIPLQVYIPATGETIEVKVEPKSRRVEIMSFVLAASGGHVR